MFITPTDFTGKYELHRGMYSNAMIQDYIDIYVKRYLIDLLGADLYKLFIADLDLSEVPLSPNYQAIYFPFEEDGNINTTVISEGLKQMLKGFVYFEYMKDLTNQTTINGQTIPQNENSLTATSLYSMMYTRFNEAVRTYRAIQWYIITNMTAKGGQVTELTLSNPGTNYVDTVNVVTTGGVGTGLTVDIVQTGGIIDTVTINQSGLNYEVNDSILITGGDQNATVTVTKVGQTFKEFYGRRKELMTWL